MSYKIVTSLEKELRNFKKRKQSCSNANPKKFAKEKKNKGKDQIKEKRREKTS